MSGTVDQKRAKNAFRCVVSLHLPDGIILVSEERFLGIENHQ